MNSYDFFMLHKPFSRAGIAWEVNRKLDRVEVNDDGTTRIVAYFATGDKFYGR